MNAYERLTLKAAVELVPRKKTLLDAVANIKIMNREYSFYTCIERATQLLGITETELENKKNEILERLINNCRQEQEM